ncbi:MAG TPA: hypothetical protein P5081_06000 [Phycisphaerae bacterium]|nr:hypothetical protein [Phycisphaerae bacterium]HRW52420.1 hypothetical protein [Phycisphaerae bacterium]
MSGFMQWVESPGEYDYVSRLVSDGTLATGRPCRRDSPDGGPCGRCVSMDAEGACGVDATSGVNLVKGTYP